MAEEFEAAGIYGGNWWNNMMNTCSLSSSSLCSIAANNDYGGGGGGSNFSCTWQTHHHNNLMDLRPPLVPHDSLGFLFHDDDQKQNQNESSPSSASESNGKILMDSTLGFSLPPASTSLLGGVDSCNNSEMKRSMNQEFDIEEQNLSFRLYDDDDDDEEHNIIPLHHFQPEDRSLFTNPSCVAYSYNNSTNQVSPASNWSSNKAPADHFLKPKHHQLGGGGGFHFPNNTISSADHVLASSSPQSQTFEHKPSFSPLLTKHKKEEVPVNEEPPAALFKRPRLETPSPLPTFKVRKEKLGDRITALQQLVSPFGKTDTASVLHEAIDYIKYLQDQVLSAPYLNNNAPAVHHQHYQGCEEKERKQDLRSQGLCLAPISSTFSLANYDIMASELWSHAYGGPHLLR